MKREAVNVPQALLDKLVPTSYGTYKAEGRWFEVVGGRVITEILPEVICN